ncbi:hypothetical protein BDV95DRAFT_608145 [Massariosphaeria phaeospora]|uniref:Rhodopsin domain-containing protein n=1 Tax=Massariosphaeria phaeospora TaxID=100035 RepID=A0A7C8I3S7_9PLEO|nr:hypothetical protein BDV95DRAFT_608145 [Massariosphaeria phaeospora]
MDLPVRPTPPGVTANFDHPEFLGLSVLVTAGICLPLVLLFAAVRLYVRIAVSKGWKLEDYIFCLSCPAGIALMAFSISLVLTKPNAYHAWDVREGSMTKNAMVHFLTFSVILGPVLWLMKLTLFCFLLQVFGSVRWLKNCVCIGIVVTGLGFASHTIVATMACGPRPDSKTDSYLNGLNRKECTSPTGVYAITSMLASIFNALSDLYLVVLPLPLISRLDVTAKQMHGVRSIYVFGVFACLCGFLGFGYRVKSWETTDFTGAQIPIYASVILEISLGLIIPCMLSVHRLWYHATYPDITDTTTIGTPDMRLMSPASSRIPFSPPDSRATWHKTHHNIDELPYRKASIRHSPDDLRFKALPSTPLPVALPATPQTPMSPKTPNSMRSMQLPIMFQPF